MLFIILISIAAIAFFMWHMASSIRRTNWPKRKKTLILSFIIVAPSLVLLAGLIIVGIMGWEVRGWHLNYIAAVRETIPPAIKTEEIVADDYSEALPGGWCDGLTYKINETTLKQINEEGLAFFKGQVPTRPVKTRSEPLGYWSDWKEKPNSLPDDEAQIPNGCLHELDDYKQKNGYDLKSNTKVYYTYVKHRGYSNISVYPEWGIVVYGSWAN